jgi:hypothetical protein
MKDKLTQEKRTQNQGTTIEYFLDHDNINTTTTRKIVQTRYRDHACIHQVHGQQTTTEN